MKAFANDFYLKPLFDTKEKLVDCSCTAKIKNKKAETDFHRISIGQADLLHWHTPSDELEVTAHSDCAHFQQGFMVPSLSMFVSLNGSIVTVADGHNIGGHASGFHVFSHKENVHQHWGKNSQVLWLTVPLSTCSELLAQSGITNAEEDISLNPGVSLSPHAKPLIINIINNLTSCYERISLGFPFQETWNKQIEGLAATFLLQHLHSSFSNHTEKHQAYLEGHNAPKPVTGLEKLEDYLLKHLAAPISLDDMTKVSGYSRSYLHKICLKYMSVSPMVWLRNLRLDAVDEHLKTRPGVSVTDIALLYGFGHMGRFSGYFHKRFGYQPSSLKNV